jgi:small subunit ribosomal protein S6
MALYESVFIIRQDVATAQVETMAAEFAELVKANGGEVTKTEMWGLKSLTYRIRKNRKGHYVLMNLNAPPAALAEMERNMRINEDVLRYLSVRVEEHEEGPSAMLRARDERPRREGDRGGFRDREGGGGFGGDRGGFRDRGPREDRPPREEVGGAA